MTRLILLIILGLVAALYFPDSRHMVLEKASPILTPVFRWQTGHELNEVARSLQTLERENYGRLPNRRQWPGWIESNFFGEAARDSWGNVYFLTIQRDSFHVSSAGPDRVVNTVDDIVVSRKLARPDLY